MIIAICDLCENKIDSSQEATKLSPFGKWLCKKCFDYSKAKMHENKRR
jgi:hypothetical protein